MARNTTRRQIVNRAVQARRPANNGGTTAPRSAAGGPRTGLGQRRPAQGRIGLGNARPAKGQGGLGGGAPVLGGAPTPAYKPTPWNSKAEEIVNSARKKYLGENTNFDLAEQEIKQDFGLEGPRSKNIHGVHQFQLSPGFNDYQSNPYSRAALLEKSFQNANRGTMNSRGLQLYSGSTSNQLAGNRGTYDKSHDELEKLYRDALGEVSEGRAKAAEEKAEKERQAEWERIEAAEAVEPDAEAAPPNGGDGRGKSRKRKANNGGNRGGGGPAVGRGRKAR
jgi:hypothetical protein